ncbi:Ncs2p [Sugiyamaella lignohabitans]|uniref:Cytoplasmic tRNA 2-thiolation protein 2 n=1 Tax=Sugiyamaella lignohabitans TaxID=796027 RepID=A0A167FGG3_9ASCO|nr:Ncs2p [Sugiyamaella lignohabitans]ANB15269.1 Ncs2p [Sugiyamaella lignohabitans]
MTTHTTDSVAPCKRCQEPSVLISRSEPFCKKCFVKFVQYKQKKRMEDYKVNYTPGAKVPDVLLPLSFGRSSLALLDMVADMLRFQSSTHGGRQGLHLHAVHIDETGIHGMDGDVQETLQNLRAKYPECSTITSVKLESFLEDPSVNREVVKIVASTSTVSPNNTKELLAMLVKRTPQQDMLNIIRLKIIEKVARDLNCTTIIWGHSMTRLAELVISLTAKGRGNTISDILFSEQSEPRILYPLNEVLGSEVADYIQVQSLDQFVLSSLSRRPATTKLQSIDELVNQYFVSVEQGFPSVVSTVVKTAAKLAPSSAVYESRQLEVSTCKICGGPAMPDSLEWLEKITVNFPPSADGLQENQDHQESKDTSNELCYGCITLFKDSMVSELNWPKRSTKEEVLAEYSLE